MLYFCINIEKTNFREYQKFQCIFMCVDGCLENDINNLNRQFYHQRVEEMINLLIIIIW